MPEYDEMLFNVYEKLWSELSKKDKSIVSEIAGGMTKVKDLREKLGFSTQMINQYRRVNLSFNPLSIIFTSESTEV